MKESSEFVAGDWTCVQCGVGSSAKKGQAGVMIMLKRSVFDSGTIRYNHAVAGRVLHVRAQSKNGWVDIVGAYLHAWGGRGDEAEIAKNRSKVWTALRTTLGQLPRGNQLILCGDLNTTLHQQKPHIGAGMCTEHKDQSPDAADLVGILQDFDLQAVNTFGRHGSYTFVQERQGQQHRSFLDYVMVRRRGSTLRAAFKIVPDCPVARWRGGGRHFPVIVTLHYRRFQFVRPRPQPQWPQWKCALLASRIAQNGPDVQAFQEQVAQDLEHIAVYSPEKVNAIILKAGKQHFHIERQSSLRPPWEQPQHEHAIRNMWSQYKLAQQQFRRCASGLRACFRAWRCRTRFQQMHRAVARNSRLLRRYRFDGLLRNAEAADFHSRVDQLFFLLRRHAPKQPRKRAQLRSSTGALLMPQAEAKELATYWKEVTTADTPTKAPIPLPFDISQEAVQQAIASLPSKKAAPAHYAPHALWTCAASSVAEVLERGLLQAWRQDEASIPDAWADAWLTFLQKPNKAGNSPQHLRPIALLDPVGKAVTGILRQQLDTHILPHMVTQHQYGFLPSRSVQQALGRAFMHCRAVRDLCQAQRRSLYEQKAGNTTRGCAGGMQLSIDLTQAFDRVSRGLLEAALIYIGVPLDLRSLLLRWVHAVHYVVQREGHKQRFGTTQGIRQGCRLSPSLWNCVVIYLTHLLEQRLGNDWCRQHQVGYADDNLFQWTFRSREEVTQAIHEAGIIIEVFEGHGLMVSKDKTAVLLRLAGPQATALRRKITKRVEGQSHLVLGPDLTLPLKAKHVYLGAIISFDRFEEYTADHRCQAGIATYHRLRKHLHSKRAWPLHKRIRLWKAYVLPTVFYALTASGLTSNGAARLRIELVRQLRAIAGRPRHITLESDAQFMSSIGVEPPLQALVQRQQRVLEKTRSLQGRLSAQDVRLDPALLAHETNISQHFQELVQPSNTTGAGADLPCPDCGQRFPTEASLRQHRAVVHRRGENKPRAERFDRLLHGQDGLPQCINCGHKFRLWEELQRHVELGRCQAPARADYDDVHPPLLAKVLQNEIVFPDVLLSPPGEDLKQELKERCAICRTWLPNENYMKVHYGRVRPDEWKAHSSRLRVWCSQNLPPIKGTCQFCGHRAQPGRDHRTTCPALFQLGMTWFVNGGPPERVDMTGLSEAAFPTAAEIQPLLKTCLLCHEDISRQRLKTHMQRYHSKLWNDMQPQVQTLCAAWVGSVTTPCSLCSAKSSKKAEHVHTCVPLLQHALKLCTRHHGDDSGRGAYGRVQGLPSSSGDASGREPEQCTDQGGGRGSGHAQSGQAVTAGSGAEQASSQRRQGQRRAQGQRQSRHLEPLGAQQLGFQHVATPASPGTRSAGGGPLQIIFEAGGRTSTPQDREAVPFAHGVGTAGPSSPPVEGCSSLEGWQGQNTTNGDQLPESCFDQVHAGRMGCQAGPHDQERGDPQEDGGAGMGKSSGRERADVELPAMECSESSAGTGSKSGAHQPHHGGQDSGGPPGTGYVRSRAAHPSFSFDAQADGNHCGGHTPLHPVSGNERLQSPAGTRRLQPPGGERGLSVGGDQATGRKDALAALGTAHCQNGGRPPPLKAADILTATFPLHDRHGYMVACMLAWLMAGADHHDVDYMAGSLAYAVKSFLTVGTSFRLASSLPWRPFLQGWDMLSSDVVQWLMHILPKAAAPVLQGTWEARAPCNQGYECTASGNTWAPMCLQADSTGDTCDLDLNALFSAWRVQGDRCALVQAPQVLCVTSPRWLNSAAGEQRVIFQGKVQDVVHVPCFNAVDASTYNIAYNIVSVVMHNADDGHFGARYWASFRKTGWHSHAHGKTAKQVKQSDTAIYARHCRAVFLRKADGSANGGTT